MRCRGRRRRVEMESVGDRKTWLSGEKEEGECNGEEKTHENILFNDGFYGPGQGFPTFFKNETIRF